MEKDLLMHAKRVNMWNRVYAWVKCAKNKKNGTPNCK